MHHPEEAISIVQQWSDEHQQRTYLSELLTHFPKVKLDGKGTPNCVCPSDLGLHDMEGCKKNYSCACIECWNQPIEDSKER